MNASSAHRTRRVRSLHMVGALCVLLGFIGTLRPAGAEDDVSDLLQDAKPVTTAPSEDIAPQTQPGADMPDALGTHKFQTPAGARHGAVTLNSGTVLTGTLWTTLDTPFRLWIEERKAYQDIDLSLVRRIDVKVIAQSMEDDWRWLKEGSDQKIFSGKKYPNVELAYTFTLVNGQQVEGTVVAPIYLIDNAAPPKRHSLALYKKYKGKLDETLNDIVYIKSIVLEDAAPGQAAAAQTTALPRLY